MNKTNKQTMEMNKQETEKQLNQFIKPKQVRLTGINLNEEYKLDLLSGKGFIISEGAYTKKTEKDENNKGSKKYVKNPNGIMSPKFCTDYGDDWAFAERYSCECKETKGKKKDGEICPSCGTKVEFVDVDYDMTGWIDLKSKYVIAPGYYELVRSLIGKNILPEICNFNKKVNLNGMIEEDVSNASKKNPFYGIGVTELKERFPEIVAHFVRKNKDKAKLGQYLLGNLDAVFIHAIPVFNAVLRPEVFEYNNYSYYDINTMYKSMYNKSLLLTEDPLMLDKLVSVESKSGCEEYTQEQILSQIQDLVVRLDTAITKLLKGKEGFIQQNIKGGRMDWTARAVIISDMTLKSDEIAISYLAAMEEFKFQIIGYLSEMKDISLSKAYAMWHKATLVFDNQIYEIINYMVRKGIGFLVNRNPTINYGSFMYLRVKSVSKDMGDLTLRMPLSILTAYNADFDGDQLNMYAMTTDKFNKEFARIFNPVYNMFISRMTGTFDRAFDLIKDQSVTIFDWNRI